MKRIKEIYLICIFLMLYATHATQAQIECGTVITAEEIRSIELASNSSKPHSPIAKGSQQSPDLVPIQIHIACSGGSNSSCVISDTEIDSYVSLLNSYFVNSNMEFFECASRNRLYHSDYADSELNINDFSTEQALAKDRDKLNVINIYFVGNIFPSKGGYTRTSIHKYDRIFVATEVSNNPIDFNELILLHEMGHYFDLYHTHGPGNYGSTTELVDGSNCDSAGDFVCDTPADPAPLGYTLINDSNQSCDYPFAIPNPPCPFFCDANGDMYQPPGNNVMRWSHCEYGTFSVMTPGQYQRIRETFENERSYLKVNSGLMMRDCWNDQGLEPTTDCELGAGTAGAWHNIWEPPDLWSCNTPGSSCLSDEQPDHTIANTMRVRIKNKGCGYSTSDATLHLYWTMGQTGETWDDDWLYDPVINVGGPSGTCIAGQEITDFPNAENDPTQVPIPIPSISPGAEIILSHQWTPPDPNCFELISEAEIDNASPMICYLARIVSAEDPIQYSFSSVGQYARYNNNVATRNSYFLNYQGPGGGMPPPGSGNGGISGPGPGNIGPGTIVPGTIGPGHSGAICVGVKNNNDFPMDISFHLDGSLEGFKGINAPNNFSEMGTMRLYMDDEMWKKWEDSGYSGNGVSVENKKRQIASIDDSQRAVFTDLAFDAQEIREVCVEFELQPRKKPVTFGRDSKFKLRVYHSLPSGIKGNESSSNIMGIDFSPKRSTLKGSGKQLEKLDSDIRLIPNPMTSSNGALFLDLTSDEKLIIGVFDLSGKKIVTIAEGRSFEAGSHEIQLEKKIPAGIYFLKVQGSMERTIKFVVL